MRSDALFISVQRSRISPRAVSDLVKKYSKAGIGTEISPHKLRSAFFTILYDETKDITLYLKRSVIKILKLHKDIL